MTRRRGAERRTVPWYPGGSEEGVDKSIGGKGTRQGSRHGGRCSNGFPARWFTRSRSRPYEMTLLEGFRSKQLQVFDLRL